MAVPLLLYRYTDIVAYNRCNYKSFVYRLDYNKPLPPIRISDLNERTFFNERDTENPEIRDMFKALGIIESFGMGKGKYNFFY